MASPLQKAQTHDDRVHGSRKVKVTILASEWGSSNGGLSTINRELAIQLAKFPEVEITLFLPKCSQEDKNVALDHKVKIVEATPLSCYEQLDWLCSPPEDLEIDIVVGHGVKLGKQAQVIKKSKTCKWVQVVHTDPEELGMFKSYSRPISKGAEKHKNEVELCEKADHVIGIGPKLSEAYRLHLCGGNKDGNVFELTPGVFEEFKTEDHVSRGDMRQHRVLVFGRGDVEDFELKGFDIAGKAIAALQDTCLVFVGAPTGKHEEIAERLTECGVPESRLKVRGFVQDREELKCLFQEVDLVIMPSRTEGFGLTGLEALSAGLPVLVSRNSGFGEALCSVPFGQSFVISSDDPAEWSSAIKKVWAKDENFRLKEADTLRSLYDEKYNWREQIRDLINKMISWSPPKTRGSSTSFVRLEASQRREGMLVTQQARVPMKFDFEMVKCRPGRAKRVQSQETAPTPNQLTVDPPDMFEDVLGTPGVPGNSETPLMEVTSSYGRQNDKNRAYPSTQDVLAAIASRYLKTTNPSTVEEFNGFLYYMRDVRKVLIVDVAFGSLIVTVECSSLETLERLWEDYCTGYLNSMAQKFLVTEEILKEFGLAEVKLTTTIKKDEYRACREHLIAGVRQREYHARQLSQKQQGEENLLRQLSDLQQNSQRQLSAMQQREENLLRQLKEMKQQKESLQWQLSEMWQREENLQRQLSEMQQREENLQRQLSEMRQREENLQRQLSEMRQREENLRRQLQEALQRDWVIARDEIQMTERCLGRGRWGSVVEGTYCGCPVAVKQIQDLVYSPDNFSLFEREMNIASKCRHPHLLQFIGATNDERSPLFVTELMAKSLRALLEQRPLSETEIAVISLDVARALNYLHQKKTEPINSWDVSSANVLLWRQGDQWRAKVSHYITANFMQQTMTVAPGATIYSAPEALAPNQTAKGDHWKAKKSDDANSMQRTMTEARRARMYSAPEARIPNQTAKVDVYSFGVLLCEMCIRELPDPRRRDEQVITVANHVLRRLVRRCLQTDPGTRPTMQTIIEELKDFNAAS